jgi:ribosomal protection tetracycline resistance protein
LRIVNLGILAHVDAGKTTLTERLLYNAGVIGEVGSVDRGSTQTDSLALERQRGITIKSAVVSFVVGDVTVNLIDTPGHPDFIAEVERVLNVLDGAVLVISAVEGVQAQTRVLMRTLQRLRIPTIIFVNKVDRVGAEPDRVLRDISAKLTPASVAMNSVTSAGTRTAAIATLAPAVARSHLFEVLAAHDDGLLAAYVEDSAVPYRRLRRELAHQTGRTLTHPVFFGSAVTGAGVVELTAGVTQLLARRTSDRNGPVRGRAFKIERGPAGEKIAYVRLFSGTVAVRDQVRFGDGHEGKISAISVFDRGGAVRRSRLAAGEIGKISGLGDIRIGDAIGGDATGGPEHHFSPPTLETVVVPDRRAARGALQAALVQLAEQDPLINLRQDDIRQELSVSLYGEVQKEVIQATLAEDYGVHVTFRATTTICIERPVGVGEAVEFIGHEANPFLATVGLRIEPAQVGSGVRFRLGVELGSMPLAFFKAVEQTVGEALHQGRYGWRVSDCAVTMTHSGYWPRQSHAHQGFDKSMSSTAGDFRSLTPLVLMAALKQARTQVYEPIHRFRLEFPDDALPAVLRGLVELRAVPQSSAAPRSTPGSAGVVAGEIPAARVHELQQRLPTLTRGEGVLETKFDHYEAVRGAPPVRARWDHNPLNRREYLLQVTRRVANA